MRRLPLPFLALLGLLAACDATTAPDNEPAEQFGAATALINGEGWRGTPFQDSIIAFCDSTLTFLQVQALEMRPGLAGALQLILHAPIGVRGYHLDDIGNQSRGEWYRPASRRVRPPHAAPEGFFVSASGIADSLVITELDIPRQRVRGRFAFDAVVLNGTAHVTIQGHFVGRLAVVAPAAEAPPR
jgi:hypothetical protein